MKTETKRHAGRENTRCTMKPHRLTCINPPGSMTGPRTEKRSARAAGQKDEHGGSAGPELPAQAGGPIPPGTDGDGMRSAGRPAPENGGGGAG